MGFRFARRMMSKPISRLVELDRLERTLSADERQAAGRGRCLFTAAAVAVIRAPALRSRRCKLDEDEQIGVDIIRRAIDRAIRR
jgi:hypothetical protein